jgi:hypothetical protein
MREFRTPQFARGQELEQSLWHCRRCAALIAIYSAAAIESAMCPICCDVTLDAPGHGNPETLACSLLNESQNQISSTNLFTTFRVPDGPTK